MKGIEAKMLVLLLLSGLVVFSPSLASAWSVTWQDDGTGNDSLAHAMNSFVFLSGDSGNFDFANPPTIDQPAWTGQVISNSLAIAYDSALAPGNFTISLSFTGVAPSTSYFEYFGYEGQKAVEGIKLYLADGSWTGNWGFIDLGNAPPAPSVPEPGTMLLLGTGLVSLGIFGRRKSRAKK